MSIALAPRGHPSAMRPGGLPLPVWLQCLMLLCLVAGALGHLAWLQELAAGLAALWLATQWRRLIPMARVFCGLACLAALGIALWDRAALAELLRALVQGAGFAALMMVLGLLRAPVRRAATTRAAAERLLAFPPGRRFAALLGGAHFMSLMFNVGIISMVGDLTEAPDGRDLARDPARRAMIVAAMRAAALAAIWSPIGLGFAIVSAGIAGFEPLVFTGCAFAFTLVVLGLGGLLPLLPAEARVPAAAPLPVARGSGRALLATIAISALLLMLAYGLHLVAAISFTMASVTVLPLFALAWLALESRGAAQGFGPRLRDAMAGLAELRSESAVFLSANVIGAAIALLLQASPLWSGLTEGAAMGLPLVIGCMLAVPLAAMCYLPNSIVVVMAAQLLGQTPLAAEHPVALGLALSIGWGTAICVSPISAMVLITARYCAVTPGRVARRWNLPYVGLILACGSVAVALAYGCGL